MQLASSVSLLDQIPLSQCYLFNINQGILGKIIFKKGGDYWWTLIIPSFSADQCTCEI